MASIKWTLIRNDDEQFVLQPATSHAFNPYSIRPAEMAQISFRAKDCVGFYLHPILEVAESATVDNLSHAIHHARWQSTVAREDGDIGLADTLLGFADHALKLLNIERAAMRRGRLATLKLSLAAQANREVAR